MPSKLDRRELILGGVALGAAPSASAVPEGPGLEALKRIKANTVEKRLLNERREPSFGINFYVVDAKGRYAGVTMSGRAKFAVCTECAARIEDCEPLISR